MLFGLMKIRWEILIEVSASGPRIIGAVQVVTEKVGVYPLFFLRALEGC